ncbi:hypothetical protein [Holdemania filiformis]|uniref:hypothetical protein n=1 Tax=Holdemania filiformis TaxID=61171 RepID=UPI00242B8F40|nr:hypothetical protein [Holdemania filiformis]
MLRSIKLFFEELEANEILYCHWKSNEHLLPALEGETDLDMLFLPEQRAKLEEVLNKFNMKRFRDMPLMQYNAVEDFIGFDVETAKIWHLHLHYRLTLGEKHLKGYTISNWGRWLIENRILSENKVYTSCFEDELILLLSRIALKIRFRDLLSNIGDDETKELTWLLERIDNRKLQERLHLFLGDEARCEMEKQIQKIPVKMRTLLKLQKILRHQLEPFTSYTQISSFFARERREFAWLIGAVLRHGGFNPTKPSRRVSPSGGCAVAFVGSDGAGKSTTIAYLNKEFSKKIDVKCIYLGSGDGSSSLLRKPMKAVAKKVGGKGLGDKVEKEYEGKSNKISIKARLYSFAKIIWALTLAVEKKKKIKKITKARNSGMLVLIDRYPQIDFPGYSDGPLLDKYLSNQKGILYKIALFEKGIYEFAQINKPDLALKLIVSPEIAIDRKPEMTKEQIDAKINAVMNMNIAEQSYVIDTNTDKIRSFSSAMEKIWEMI